MNVMLAKKYTNQNPVNYYMSEKLDGVRAIWDGNNLVSRNEKIFNAPSWFTDNLPKNIILDGELYEGRGLFQKTVGKIRAKKGDWSSINYMVFDVVNNDCFEKRYMELKNLLLPGHCSIVRQTWCYGVDHLKDYEENIISLGGEGVMLRAYKSLYEHKRSNSLLKVKRFNQSEAIVINYHNGNGRNNNVVGALVCTWNNIVFKLGSGLSDTERKEPPPVGSLVAFSYFETTLNGIPRFPVYVGIRDYEGGIL